MNTLKGSPHAVTDREHDLEKQAKRVIQADPFGGIVTEGNFTQYVDSQGDTLYLGFAQIGTATDEEGWQIKRITKSGAVTAIEFAEKTDEFIHIWDDREAYTYG